VNEQNPQAIAFCEHEGFVAYMRTDTDEEGEPFPLICMRLADR
jgi:putative acetyltransferase